MRQDRGRADRQGRFQNLNFSVAVIMPLVLSLLMSVPVDKRPFIPACSPTISVPMLGFRPRHDRRSARSRERCHPLEVHALDHEREVLVGGFGVRTPIVIAHIMASRGEVCSRTAHCYSEEKIYT
ncbi:MAG: hypothetical protein CK534_02755 [Nitrospirae bacterium]|nr:MAG: hypothetical protein CK534_02755 [Nitrospirota bacterium]